MRLNHLSLTNFRNYARLELGLPARLSVFQGANAQGKTNLLESIHLLATARSPRAAAERELINWLALESPLPYARLAAEIGDGHTVERLELVLELGGNGGARRAGRAQAGADQRRGEAQPRPDRPAAGRAVPARRRQPRGRRARASAGATSTLPCARSTPRIAAR